MRNPHVAAIPLVQPERLDDIDVRYEYTGHYSFAIANPEALDAIADHAPNGILEVCAGGGYWAALLRAHGVPRVEAFDSHPTPPPAQPAFGTLIPDCYSQFICHSWGGVRAATADIAASYPELALMLCWPPEQDRAARIALDRYEGDTVIYVGELPEDVLHRQPHMADPLFFRELRCGWHQVERVTIPQWEVPADGEHDSLTIWRRGQ